MTRSRFAAAASGLLIAAASSAPAAPAPSGVSLVDDQGMELTGTVSVCTTVGLKQRCADQQVVNGTVAVPAFEVLRIEGPAHGPADFRRLPTEKPLKIPRKAILSISHTPVSGLTLSLYQTADPSFRRPLRRFEVNEGPVRIPAGAWLLSLSEPGQAPDLEPVAVAAGERLTVRYNRRPGWSLVLRTVDASNGEPLNDTTMELSPVPGYGDAAPRRARSTVAGLAVVSGLELELADATIKHARYLPGRAPALSASDGTFAARQVGLEKGGEIDAAIRIDGTPTPGVVLRVRRPASEGPEPWQEVTSGRTDTEGRFHVGPLASGTYSVEVEPPGGEESNEPSTTLVSARVENGETTPLDIDLVQVELSGEVRNRSAPAVGYSVRVGRLTPGSSTQLESVGEARTDEEGRYRLTLWETGEYQIYLHGTGRSLVDHDWVWVGRDGARKDFDLEENPVTGCVVHEDGRPATEASVVVRWNRARVTSFETESDGCFELLFNGGGSAEVSGYLTGYGETEAVALDVPIRGVGQPLLLRLGGRRRLSGRVTSGGRPATGVRVAAYRPVGPATAALGAAVSDPEGRFTLPAGGDAVRLFLSGPGCPLTAMDVSGLSDDLELACPASGANVIVHLEDDAGGPGAGEALTLATARRPVPGGVLAAHLAALGLPTRPTSTGEWVLPALAAGPWELFATSASNHATIAGGQPLGHLASLDLAPGATVEVSITVDD